MNLKTTVVNFVLCQQDKKVIFLLFNSFALLFVMLLKDARFPFEVLLFFGVLFILLFNFSFNYSVNFL